MTHKLLKPTFQGCKKKIKFKKKKQGWKDVKILKSEAQSQTNGH